MSHSLDRHRPRERIDTSRAVLRTSAPFVSNSGPTMLLNSKHYHDVGSEFNSILDHAPRPLPVSPVLHGAIAAARVGEGIPTHPPPIQETSSSRRDQQSAHRARKEQSDPEGRHVCETTAAPSWPPSIPRWGPRVARS